MPFLGIVGLSIAPVLVVIVWLDVRRILREDREWEAEKRLVRAREWEIEDGPILVLDARQRESAPFN